MLQIELKQAIKDLKKLKAKKVYLQIPEGLKIKVDELATELENNGLEVVTGMDPCFGACDIKQSEAKMLGCNAILHLGHTQFVSKSKIPTVYAPLNYELGDRFELIKKIAVEWIRDSKVKEIGIVTTAQFLHYLPELKKAFDDAGIKATIGKGKRTENGQVLGCNYSSAEVKPQVILFFGDGLFHPLGIHFATQKQVVIANPLTLEMKTLDEEKNNFLKKRIMLIERAKAVKDYAILVSTKEGQNRMSEAEKIKKELEKNGKVAKIYCMDFISNDALLGIKAEAMINTACPRISIDDYMSYKLPIINYPEVDYLLGKKKYEDYKLVTVF